MSKTKTNVLLLALAASCGSVAQMAVDGGDGDAEADARPEVVTDLQCVTTTYVYRAPDNSRTESDSVYAVVDGVPLGEDFWVESCDLMQQPPSTCPAGYTCTQSGAPYPTGRQCYRGVGGQFIEGRLVVSCGGRYRAYDAAGTMTYSSSSIYGTVRLHRP